MEGADSKGKPERHTLADHALGADPDHVHDGDADHDHDAIEQAGLLPPGMPADVVLTSIGIDIGSSGTQVAFSRLKLENAGEHASTRFLAGGRDLLYESPVSFTPYRPDGTIDANAVATVVDDAFAAAGLHPDDIHTGIVLLTGAALERSNAEALADALADRCGDIVSAAAGHHMEAVLAAFGSGAARLSHRRRIGVLNIDIGGGTTKFAAIRNGHVVATSAIAVGGRQLVSDDAGCIARLEPAAAIHARRLGLDLTQGAPLAPADIDRLAAMMAADIVAEITAAGTIPDDLRLTAPLPRDTRFAAIVVSGGVGEYVYGRETRDFGDLGRALGAALADRLRAGAGGAPLEPAAACIRATVVGSASHAVQLSGSTCFIPDPALLPCRGLPVIAPHFHMDAVPGPAAVAQAITAHREVYGIGCDGPLAIAVHWTGDVEYGRIAALARGLRDGLADRIAEDWPLVVVVDADIARTLGSLLVEELHISCPILILDGIELADLDILDIGRIRLPSGTVPVTIKSLAFRYDWRQEAALKARAHQRAHDLGLPHSHDRDDHRHHGHHHKHRH